MDFKKITLSLALSTIPFMGFSAEYYVRPAATGSADGSSWDNAIAFATMYENINNYNNGDTFYFSGGVYTPAKVIGITNGYTFIGGFDPALTGTNHDTPIYPSSTPTVFSGDLDGDGAMSPGDLNRLLAFNTATKDDSKKVILKGVEFTKAYSTQSTTTEGALWIRNCGYVEVDNCRFYGNVDDKYYGGMAFTGEYSTAYFNDCEFTNNRAVSRGGAIRLSSNSGTKGLTVFNRCLITNNKVDKNVGSAILVQQGIGLYLINCMVTGNKSGEETGAIYSNGSDATYSRNVYIVNSTIAGNEGGAQVQMTDNANLYVANSIVVGNDTHAPFNITSTKDFTGKYNIVGNDANNILSWDETNMTGKGLSDVFGSQDVASASPTIPYGATAGELSEMVSSWGIAADLTVDKDGVARGSVSVPGAKVGEPQTTTIDVTDIKYATYYNSLGYIMPESIKGAVAPSTSGDRLTTDWKYQPGNIVPAASALLVSGEAGSHQASLKLAENSKDENLLKGSDIPQLTSGGSKYFKLANDAEGGLGFYYGAADGTAFTNGAHKAYLAILSESPAKAFFFTSETTGINQLAKDAEAAAPTYNLTGQRISKSYKGIAIRNGKKYMVK
ncbi:right-handed parallel beta-helix repeat-containing protein [Prevotella sp. KH2C16]|uniref:right-handed parallel beta-helix repeat-containing protein n=1 Tax=Prevotella sp. KH2C16 TaxID=1855325 RepID=UPI0008E5698A|nr:right-handed parallel beta-helix repeat-containing protein [Prevotella sp. KH2C16]SFG25806.1 Right handed beta helix region [Prevotella sp. KH2C16]